MSTTPRTDARELAISIQNEDSCCAIYVKIDGKEYEGGLVDSDFARKLECENARLREALADMLENHDKVYAHERWACVEQAAARARLVLSGAPRNGGESPAIPDSHDPKN
jgi:hypothetical protein